MLCGKGNGCAWGAAQGRLHVSRECQHNRYGGCPTDCAIHKVTNTHIHTHTDTPTHNVTLCVCARKRKPNDNRTFPNNYISMHQNFSMTVVWFPHTHIACQQSHHHHHHPHRPACSWRWRGRGLASRRCHTKTL